MSKKVFKFQCPECNQYVELVGQLFPINEELELFCNTCHKETVLLLTRPLATEHTIQECFDHFLSYSGFSEVLPDVKGKLRLAFFAAWSRPTTGAVDSAFLPCPHGYVPECSCPTCGACVNETPSP